MRCLNVISALLGGFLLVGCSAQKEPVSGNANEVPVAMGFAVQGTVSACTKADVTYFTELANTPVFHGMSEVVLIPFFTGKGINVSANSQANGDPRHLPAFTSLLSGSQAHLYEGADAALPTGTTAMLAYGKASRTLINPVWKEKQKYGSLKEQGLEWQNTYHYASDVRFDPDPIYEGEHKASVEEVANQMADLLTDVTEVSYTRGYTYDAGNNQFPEVAVTLNWSNVEDEKLQTAFRAFKGSEDGVNFEPFNAYGVNLLHRLQTLITTLDDCTWKNTHVYKHEGTIETHGETFYWEDLYRSLRDAVKGKATDVMNSIASNEAQKSFPVNLGLPAGAADLKWKDAQFLPAPEGMDGYIPVSQYCYMPSLYYQTASTISTSYDMKVKEKFGDWDWARVLEELFPGNKIVTTDVRAVALDNPLGYGCSQLVATLTVSSNVPLLRDRGYAEFDIDAASQIFPVTGLVISGQYAQNYEFLPLLDSDPDGDYQEYYMYDGTINNFVPEITNVRPVYLARDPYKKQTIRTLVLSSPLNRLESYIYLEFENKSGEDLLGVDGVIPNGSRFYLVGKITPTEEQKQSGCDRLFERGHAVVLDCSVESLQNAYLSVPRVGNPQLSIGVQTQINWNFSPSSYVVLE